MAGVHRLEHVECFRTSNLTNDDPIGAHSQAVDHQVALGDTARSFNVGWPGFESYDMLLFELEFGRVLDRDDSLSFGNETGDGV